MTAWVCSCGSSARDVVWRNVATVNPNVSGCWRRPSTRTRVVAPNRSRCSSAVRTARSWASSRPGSPVSAHHTLTDFGAENVASNPATARTTFPSAKRPIDEQSCRAVSQMSGHGPPTAPGDRRRRPVPTGPSRSPGPRTTPPAPHPAPPDSGCSRAPSRSPTTRTTWSPATSHPPPCGHLSVEHT